MDRHQWTQEIGGSSPMAEIASSSACSRQPVAAEKKARPQRDQSLNCPRCHSTNTKFCYYNNYSLTQPRYFCKACRRYWTEGGTLRNVPVGGGSRKNKRSVPITPSQKLPDLNPPDISQFASQNPNKMMNEGQDLNLGFPGSLGVHQHASQFFDLPKILDHSSSQNQLKSSSCGNSSSAGSTPFAALELLRTGYAPRGMNSFITSTGSPGPDYSGFFFQDLKPAAVSFTVDGLGNSRYVVDPRGVQENGGRLMFPLGAMKQAPPPPSSSSEGDQNNKGQISNSNGFWNGMLGGGSW